MTGGKKAESQDISEQPAVAAMTFEEALEELEKITILLEEGALDMNAAIAHYERGARLQAHCRALLEKAQARIDAIKVEKGEVRTTPLQFE